MSNPEQPPKILVFDSGVGGLTILRALVEQLPGCEYLFASDNAGFPYGTRSEYSLINRVNRVMGHFIPLLRPDMVVIACNSASTVALPSLRDQFNTPFVGVVPAIKPAAAATRTGHIALLATPATVQRPYTLKLIADFASQHQVHMLGSGELVQMAEAKLRGEEPDSLELERILAPLLQLGDYQAIDTMVLACTHFPLLRENLEPFFPAVQHWIEPGAAIARRVASLMPQWVGGQPYAGIYRALITREDLSADAMQGFLAQFNCGRLEVFPLTAQDDHG